MKRRRGKRPACCRPRSLCAGGSPMGSWPPSAACTAWCACRPSTRSDGVRPVSLRWTSPRFWKMSRVRWRSTRKTDSAIRLTHFPSGIVVSVQNERSQHQNKAKAMQILGAKLAERARQERRAEMNALSGDRGDNAWGNQIRSYVLAPYQLVKDLRTSYETGNVDAVLDGDLEGFMEAELRRQRENS